MDILTVLQQLEGLPLHAILLGALIILWRKNNTLEQKLEDCLAKNDQ